MTKLAPRIQHSENPLPPGWRWARLREVCTLVGDSINPQKSPREAFAHYSIVAFDQGRAAVFQLGSVILSNKVLFRRGSVLFSKLNPRIARVWHVRDEHPYRRVCSTEFLPLEPNPALLDAVYLTFALQEPEVIARLRGLASAATKSRERLKPDVVLGTEIPLPPLPAQKRIAAILEEQMASAEKTRKMLEDQLEAINKLPAALLRRAFSGEL